MEEKVNTQPDQTNNEDNEKTEINFDNRLQVPYIEKKSGDELLKENQFEEALKHFSKAIMAVKILNDEKAINEEQLDLYVKEVGVPSNLNMSYCFMKLKDWKGVILHTNRVIDLDAKHVKAIYRRCLAYLNLKNFDKADQDLMDLEELIGGSKELEELEKLFESKKNEEKSKENHIYKKMFKQYVDAKDKAEYEEIQSKIQDVFESTPSVFSKVFNYALETVKKPFKSIARIPSSIKYYFIDVPLQFCRRKKGNAKII